jgi:hypothetical protein
MGMDPAYPEVLATHLCDDHGIRPANTVTASIQQKYSKNVLYCAVLL